VSRYINQKCYCEINVSSNTGEYFEKNLGNKGKFEKTEEVPADITFGK
jgi:hypothetical protein